MRANTFQFGLTKINQILAGFLSFIGIHEPVSFDNFGRQWESAIQSSFPFYTCENGDARFDKNQMISLAMALKLLPF